MERHDIICNGSFIVLPAYVSCTGSKLSPRKAKNKTGYQSNLSYVGTTYLPGPSPAKYCGQKRA